MSTSQRLIDFAKRHIYVQDWQLHPPAATLVDLPTLGPVAFQWQTGESLQQEELFLWPAKSPAPIECAYLEAFAQLAGHLTWSKLAILGVREVENFLRDHNHTPAHDLSEALTPGLWLDSLRQALLKPWLLKRLEGSRVSRLSADSEAISLAHALSELKGEFWGKKAPAEVAQSSAMNLIALPDGRDLGWEIQWYFPLTEEAATIKTFCQALETVLGAQGLRVKVVAES